MKKVIKAVHFLLPAIIYIVCSLLAFLCWQVFNQGAAPVISLNIALLIIGSLSAGFLTIGREGKKGMFLAIAAVVAGLVFWIIAFTFDNSICAYIATVFSSYFFNIQTCLPIDAPEYTLYLGYAISFAAPILLILLGRFIRVKALKSKA
ncbi:MAG: hypothetical protein K2I14_06460 [Eubacterium sp.]|nr:hypothetical protein [Eubacterium sp.]